MKGKTTMNAGQEEKVVVVSKEELVALLRGGKIEEFNKVRPYPIVDLSWADLSEADLSWADFSRANLWWAKGLSEERRKLILKQLEKSWK